MARFTAENETFIKAYNEYLETNNLTQAKSSVYARLGDKVIPIDYDMFYDWLIGAVALNVITNHKFNNTLENLYSDSIPVGMYVIDKRTVLAGPDAEYSTKEFETDVTNPYIKEKSGISVVYHKVNKHRKIRRTVSYAQIQEAFSTEGGISSLVNAVINDLSVEKSAWEYSDMRSALCDPDYTTVVEFDDYADFNIKVRNVLTDVQYYDNSYKYNAALLYSPMSLSDVAIIMSEKFRTEEDINFFTGLFNVSYAELKEHIQYVDEFDNPDIKAMIIDKRGLFFKKSLDETRTLPNPEDLTINYFVHFWRMHSVSPHYNAIAFMQKKDGVTNATASIPQAYLASEEFQFSLTVPEGFEAYYTTDGSTPTKSSTKYTAKFAVNKSETIKVLTVATDGTPRADGEDIKIYRVRFIA